MTHGSRDHSIRSHPTLQREHQKRWGSLTLPPTRGGRHLSLCTHSLSPPLAPSALNSSRLRPAVPASQAKSSQWAGARAAESPARGERAPPPGRREQGRRPPPPPAVWDPALSGARHSGGGAQPMVGPVLVRPGRRPRVRNPTRPRDGRGEGASRAPDRGLSGEAERRRGPCPEATARGLGRGRRSHSGRRWGGGREGGAVLARPAQHAPPAGTSGRGVTPRGRPGGRAHPRPLPAPSWSAEAAAAAVAQSQFPGQAPCPLRDPLHSQEPQQQHTSREAPHGSHVLPALRSRGTPAPAGHRHCQRAPPRPWGLR
nr:translation initiation factor IF-2-like [Equus asinus]